MWADINARHLLALRSVHEEGTFGRAAERLGFTQSAVSQQVASLEQIVGHALFDRHPGPNPPTLTPAGELVLEHAAHVLGALEAAEHDLDRMARGLVGTLRVSTFQSISARVLPFALRSFYDTSPDVEILIVDDNTFEDSCRDAIVRGEIDLAFVVGDVGPDFGSRELGTDPHVAVVQAGEKPGALDLLDLQWRPLIGQPEEDTCGRLVDRGLERLGVTPKYAFRSHDNGAMQGMVAAGVGVAVMPLLTVDASDPRTEIRATEPKLDPRRMSIIWDPNRTLPPLAERFIQDVVDVCAEMLSMPDQVSAALST